MGNIYDCLKLFLCSYMQVLCTLYFAYIFIILFDEVLKNFFYIVVVLLNENESRWYL